MRKRKFEFTITDEEAALIEAAATRLGLPVATYLRMAALEAARRDKGCLA